MINFIKIFFIVLFLFELPSSILSVAAATSDSGHFQVKIFDVGQGNCVAVKYNGKSILIDCGTKSLTYTAQYHKAAGKGTALSLSKVAVTKEEATAKADSDDESDTEEVSKALGKTTLHTPSPKAKLKAGITPAREAKDSSSEDSGDEVDKKTKEALREAYKIRIIEEIREFLGDTIQAVIITHADEDHYSLIPEVTDGKTVEKVIVSGQDEDYLDSRKISLKGFRDWIERYATEHKILSTEEFYFSDKDPKSAKEEQIEQAITFASSAAGSDKSSPEIKILAMNATAGRTRDPNADSIVLKITYDNESILLPGDATEATWEAIRTVNSRSLKSNYFLISHHGAATHGSTSPDILTAIDPEAIFVSAGRYRGYYHPERSVIDMLLSSLNLGENSDLQNFVTYFSEKKHRRLTTSSLLFTTLNNGTITIDLGKGSAHMAHAKAPTQYRFGSKSYTADKRFAFKEQSVSDPSNPERLFSALAKTSLGRNKVCFFTAPEGKSGGIATLIISAKTEPSASPDTCEHAFLIKQKTPADEEIIVYLTPTDTRSLAAVSETGGGEEAGAGRGMKAAAVSADSDDKNARESGGGKGAGAGKGKKSTGGKGAGKTGDKK